MQRSRRAKRQARCLNIFCRGPNRHPGAVEHGQKAATGHDYDPSSVLHQLSGHNPAVVIDGTYRCNVIATHQPGKVLHMGSTYGALFFCHFTDYS